MEASANLLVAFLDTLWRKRQTSRREKQKNMFGYNVEWVGDHMS
jgi:hypothetical protein